MSTTLTLVNDMIQHVIAADPIPNPAPAAPKGASGAASTLMGIVKWGALFVIIGAGFAGAGALAGGHILSHQRSGQIGVRILIGAVIAALIYAVIYGFLTSLAA